MKHIYSFGAAFAILLIFIITPASAILISNNIGGDVVVYDDLNKMQWVADLTIFGGETYTEVKTHTAGLNYAGITDWKLASASDITLLISQVDVSNIYLFTYTGDWGWQDGYKWEGLIDELGTRANSHQQVIFDHRIWDSNTFETIWGYGGLLDDCDANGAWVVSKSNPVPEPTTMLLFGAGLVGLAGFGRKKFKI
jgi:hypothetical protein